MCSVPKEFVSRVSVVQHFLTQIDVNGKGARLLGIMHLMVIKMFPWSFRAKQKLLPFI